MNNPEVCEHCGHELTKASVERKEISDNLIKRHEDLDSNLKEREDKIDAHLKEREELLDSTLAAREKKIDATAEDMLAMVQRMEKRMGADLESREAIRVLENKIRERVAESARRDDWLDKRIQDEGKDK